MIRTMQFAHIINKDDFIDIILQRGNRADFRFFVCVRNSQSNIAAPVYPTDVRQLTIPGLSRWNIPLAAVRLARQLSRLNIDVLHTHHYDQAVIGWMATRLRPATRFIVGRHYSNAIYLLSGGWKKSLLLGIEEKVNSAADKIIVPSRMISQLLMAQGVDPAKINLVYYAFSPEKWRDAENVDRSALRASHGLNGLVFGHFSRMNLEKGHTYLLKAVAKICRLIPEIQVLLIGDGPMRPAVEREIAELGLEKHVRLLGWRRDALKIMAAVDAVVHPTLQEAFPQTMVEALYLKKPLVITPVSGAEDIIEDGVNGLLVPVRDPDALAAAMMRLSSDPVLRRRLGEAGRDYVEHHLSADKIIPQYEEIYRSVAR